MSDAIDYQAIRTFLEEHEYSVDFDEAEEKQTFYISKYADSDWHTYAKREKDVYQLALGHFLTGELGRKWHDTWRIVLASSECPFDGDECETIYSAIRFYEALEEGEKEED